jgi:hypothetical protein
VCVYIYIGKMYSTRACCYSCIVKGSHHTNSTLSGALTGPWALTAEHIRTELIEMSEFYGSASTLSAAYTEIFGLLQQTKTNHGSFFISSVASARPAVSVRIKPHTECTYFNFTNMKHVWIYMLLLFYLFSSKS